MMTSQATDILIIGAGPIGIELAAALKRAGADYLQLDAGQIGQTISWYPRQARFFSSPERIAIAGLPLVTPDQGKATREAYLAYLRGVVIHHDLAIATYHRVTQLKQDGGGGFEVQAVHAGRMIAYRARRVVLAVGDMHRPRLLGVPGEDLPHVSHYFQEPHTYFRQQLLIVGGRNSAVEAAIRCFRAGARVSISYRQDQFDTRSIKYWLLPELLWLIKHRHIDFYPQTAPASISPGKVILRQANELAGVDPVTLDADFVLILTGYEMDATLLTQAGVKLHGVNHAPLLDDATQQTSVPGLYVAGTAAAGTQLHFRLFIENCHAHVEKLAAHLTGKADAGVFPRTGMMDEHTASTSLGQLPES
jgi:thioredoxin reductase (NADPH)